MSYGSNVSARMAEGIRGDSMTRRPLGDPGHRVTMRDGRIEYETLADILPGEGRLEMLIIGKRPAPTSVQASHYLQGRQGQLFWKLMRDYGILSHGHGYADDLLAAQGFGITDVVKRPAAAGNEPTDEEYKTGARRIAQILSDLKPRVALFLYKPPLVILATLLGSSTAEAKYGFNEDLKDVFFGSEVFLFPMPGTPCSKSVQVSSMSELRKKLLG